MIDDGATFDFVIVGAGAAGCAMANRLSAQGGHSVCLLEAGPPDRSPLVPIPLGCVVLARNKALSWRYSTEAEPATASKPLPFARGKVLGGTTTINGMVYMRGHPSDYDDWAAAGNVGWSYADVLPYFRRAENNHRWRDSPFHGSDGPVDVSDPAHVNPLADAFVTAAQECGIPGSPDFNGANQEGAGIRQVFQRNGRRVSAASAYLAPARNRPNLHIQPDALVDRLTFEGGRCTGIEFLVGAERRRIAARREVVLSAGTIGSPMILQRSGIGDTALIRPLGITPLIDRPQVGANYQDHVNVMLRVEDPGRLSYGLSWRALGGLAAAPFDWLLRGRGLFASNFGYAGAFVRSTPDLHRPDLQLIFWPVHRPPGKFIAAGHSFGVMAHVLRPESRGEVAIRDADPRSPPRLRTGTLTDPRDVAQLIAGLRLARRVFAAPALARHAGAELEPGRETESDAALENYVRENVIMGLHCVGTCRMGPDADAVVAPDLRVNGVDGLSVADCAIMPAIIGGNTAAPAMMIGEKASDMVLARTTN